MIFQSLLGMNADVGFCPLTPIVPKESSSGGMQWPGTAQVPLAKGPIAPLSAGHRSKDSKVDLCHRYDARLQ